MANDVPAVGIDLGTTYSCVAVVQYDQITVIHGDDGERIMASCVYFTKNGETVVGNVAKELSVKSKNPENAIFGVKRFIGRTTEEFEQQKNNIIFPYIIENIKNRPTIQITYQNKVKKLAPEEISAIVLKKLKKRAEIKLCKDVTEAVITVPASFNGAQRQATIDAAKIAGLKVLRIINEPTAAALAYELENKYKKGNILVYDFGGGTFDASIVTIYNGNLDVKATNGDAFLGGDDLDKLLTEYLLKELHKEHSVNLEHLASLNADKEKKNALEAKRSIRRFKDKAEQVKKLLSSLQSYNVCMDLILPGDLDLELVITRSYFEHIVEHLIAKTIKCIEQTLKDANMTKTDIDEIVLVGGTTKMPYVQESVRKFFDGKKINTSVNPDEAIAVGAARQAAILTNSTSKNVTDVSVFDVCSLSLGTDVAGGIMQIIVPRNTKIPATKSKIFETSCDNQTSCNIYVLEGERELVRNNRKLGYFKLSGLRSAPRGEVDLEVTFKIDEDGLLHVSAFEVDGTSNNEVTIDLVKNQLSDRDIQRMIAQAEMFEAEDRKIKEQILAKIELKNKCYDGIKITETSNVNERKKMELKSLCQNTLDLIKNNKNLTKTHINEKMKVISEAITNIKL